MDDMVRRSLTVGVLLCGILALGMAVTGHAAEFAEARIYIEYNSSGNDLGFHVSLDGEDWRALRIVAPTGAVIFEVEGLGGYRELGLTELFFEGAEPRLDEFPLEDLLALFPEGRYRFIGETVGNRRIRGMAILSHAVPAGPEVSATVGAGGVVIGWEPVTGTPAGFPARPVVIVGYQVIVGSFQVTLPASSTEVTLPDEFVSSLAAGEHDFEVLAIDRSGNQSITEGVFMIE
jgi:hypothetical protein